MTTETVTPTVPEQAAPPAEPSLSAMLYSPDVEPATAPPDEVSPPATTPDPDPSPDPATPPVDSKQPEEPSAGTEDTDGKLKKQLAEQTKANKRLGKELADLRDAQRKLAEDNHVLLAKLRGDYQEPAQPTPEQTAAEAVFKERERSSRKVAEELFGAEAMNKRIYGDNPDEKPELTLLIEEEKASNAGQISPTKLAILLDDAPAVKAMRVLQTRDFVAQYGEDPTKWAEKIIADAKPKILEDLKKQLTTPVTGSQPPTVSNGRGAGTPPREKSLADLMFPKS